MIRRKFAGYFLQQLTWNHPKLIVKHFVPMNFSGSRYQMGGPLIDQAYIPQDQQHGHWDESQGGGTRIFPDRRSACVTSLRLGPAQKPASTR
jgi:hypothetical protein